MAAASILVLASCQNPFSSDFQDRVATVDSLSAPDTVAALAPFRVSIRTVVPNGCWAKGHDDAQPVAGGAAITPYDQAYTGKNACTQALVYFDHEVSLPPKGSFTISVKTRTTSVTGADSITVLTRTVQIQ
jgi:hypothetical protein